MNSAFRRLALATVAVVALSGTLLGQNKNTNRTPAIATFREDAFTLVPSDKIRGDDLGSYPNSSLGGDCVTAWVDKGGFFFLRTVTPYCTTTTPRSIVLDFSGYVSLPTSCEVVGYDQYGNPHTLDICGANGADGKGTVPDVRIIANSLFKRTAPGSTTVTLPFLLYPSFSGGTTFELDFEQAVSFTGTSSVRVLTATVTTDQPNADVAELYQYVNGAKSSLGRYHMPFQLTVTKQ